MQKNESQEDWSPLDAFMKNAAPYQNHEQLEEQIMARIHQYETVHKKSAQYFKKAKALLIIASILYILMAGLDKTMFQTALALPWLFESICILSFLFLLDKILSFQNSFRRQLPQK